MSTLFDAVAIDHHVTPADVREGLAHRRMTPDVAVILSFFVIYGMAAFAVSAWLFRRFPFEHGWTAALAALMLSIPVGAAGWVAGELWSAALESIRLGNAHASYRAFRIPWSQHGAAFLAACVAVFWLVACIDRFSSKIASSSHDNGSGGRRRERDHTE